VALVIVADPVPEPPVSTLTGNTTVPPSVPPDNEMVKGTLAVVPLNAVSGTVALKAPDPAIPPVRVAVPATVKAVLVAATLAVTDSVALEVAARAAVTFIKAMIGPAAASRTVAARCSCFGIFVPPNSYS
jgi:hypothetical protein